MSQIDYISELFNIPFSAKRADFAVKDVEGNEIVTTYAKKLVPVNGTISNDSITVRNNTVTTVTIGASSASATLTIDCTVDAGECANFACEITNESSVDCTATVTLNGTVNSAKRAVATDGKLVAGKTYQLTCVGTCWTLAEFATPT